MKEYQDFPHKMILNVEQIARNLGAPRSGNVVLLGAASPYIRLDFAHLENGIRQIFGRKGENIVEMNLKALRAGKEMKKNL
jgi:indolepyruvate ferredoxin oxidoreductase beta subunit